MNAIEGMSRSLFANDYRRPLGKLNLGFLVMRYGRQNGAGNNNADKEAGQA
jgi:hypothetical protein